MDRVLRSLQTPAALRGMLIFMAIALAAMFFVRMKLMTHHTLNMGGVDQNVIHGTLRILLGEPLYGDPEKPPFPAVQYSPAFFYVHALVCLVAGIGPEDVQGLYVSGRAISLVFNLVTCWLIVLVCRRLGLGRTLSFAAAAFFFVSLTDMYFLRPDSLYALFFWCHVLVVVKAVKDDDMVDWSGPVILWSSLFAVLAIFSKQTGLIVPAMTGFFMLVQGRWKALFRFSLACAVWTLVFLGATFLVNDPWAVYQNNVLANVNGTDLPHLLGHLTNRYGAAVTLWLIFGITISVHTLKRRDSNVHVYLALAMLVTTAWALLTALKRGSNTNYYTESQMLAVLLGLVLAVRVPAHVWRPYIMALMLLLMPLTSLLRSAMFLNATMISKYRADDPARYHSEKELSQKIREHGLAPDEYVFVLHRGYAEMFLAPRTLWNAKCIVLVSDEVLEFDLEEFYAMAADGRMKYVIADRDDTTLAFHGRPLNGFLPLFHHDRHTVYIHEKADEERPGS
jgi:hypothetical protein